MAIAQMKNIETEKAVGRAIEYLHRSQLPDGEFKSYRSTDAGMTRDCEFDSSPFPTAMIAYCLSFHDSPVVRQMLDAVAHFFLSEMEGAGVWRYWTRQHPYHRHIPPDLDDIVYISSFLRQQRTDFPANEKLILANRNRNGLFYTWIVPRISMTLESSYWRVVLREALKPVSLYYFWKLNESSPNDIDCVVNANVLFYLGEREETEPIIEYLIEVIKENREDCCDKWHLNRFTFYYALSRNYFAGVKTFEIVRETVINRILSAAQSDGTIGDNSLETALAVCALLNWNFKSEQLDKAVRALTTAQQKSGAWQIAPLYYGGPKKYYSWGSEELTTGFCIEALTRFLKKQ